MRLPFRLFALSCAALLVAAVPPADLHAQPVDSTFFAGMEYRMAGPYRGGRSTAVAGFPEKPSTYLMGTTGGGVWKTTNAGQSWNNISDGFFGGSIGAVAVAHADPSVIYVGTGSACIRGNTSTGHGAYRSMDGGKTWSFVGLPEAGQIGDIQVHPKDANVVYVAALGHPFGKNPERGVYRSTDGGDSWEHVLALSDSTGVVDLSLNPQNPREIYAAAWSGIRKPWAIRSGSRDGGVYKSTDGGDSWQRLENGLPHDLVGKTAVSVSPANPDRVWAMVEARAPEGGLYRSDDAGRSWQRVNRDRDLRQRAYYYIHVNADPQDENTVYVLNVGMHKSVDGGKSFERIQVPHGDVHDLWINPHDPTQMVVANDGGGQVSVDGAASWSTYYNQPTAEFYSVTVDDGFPYRLYAPQQDNSTISVPAWTPGDISPEQYWKSVGGCETGPIALDPSDPNIIYAGCYGGVITRFNQETQAARNVMVYPQLQLGQAPKDLKERFQWVSPIVVSPHDPQKIYHASQHVHRTTDGGHSWTTISPDLSTDTPMHQEFGGGPITNEGTGVEVYNTVFALTESPHATGTLWAGTDDGRIHITRDDGGSWTEITPPGMPEQGTVSSIVVSPHAAGTAYVAVYRYRMDDFTPYAFKTTDYGQSWVRLTDGENGIPEDHPVRVVREDPERQGLLYAGTEFGLFVSFDDGSSWQSLQLNLPVTPITDLEVKDTDLVVATQGRSFWILDDLGTLRQFTDEATDAGRHLFQPDDAYLVTADSGGEGTWPEGPTNGAVIAYYFDEAPTGTVTLEILDDQGEVLRRVTSDSSTTVGPDPEKMVEMEASERERERARRARIEIAEADRFQAETFVREEEGPLPKKAGMNRYVWNLRTQGLDAPADAVVWGFTGGVKVVPGTYTARLTTNGQTMTRTFEVMKDPRRDDVTQEDLEEQFALGREIGATLDEVYAALETLRRTRTQVLTIAEQAERGGYGRDLITAADTLAGTLSAVERTIIQTRAESFQDVINYPPRLDNQLAYLYGYVAGPDGRPTEGARQRYQDLQAEWADVRSRLQALMETEVAAFNDRVEGLDMPLVPTALPSESR